MCNFVIDFEANQQIRIANCLFMLNINRLMPIPRIPAHQWQADFGESIFYRCILGTATGLILYCHY